MMQRYVSSPLVLYNAPSGCMMRTCISNTIGSYRGYGTNRATTSFTLVGTSADFTLLVLIRRV